MPGVGFEPTNFSLEWKRLYLCLYARFVGDGVTRPSFPSSKQSIRLPRHMCGTLSYCPFRFSSWVRKLTFAVCMLSSVGDGFPSKCFQQRDTSGQSIGLYNMQFLLVFMASLFVCYQYRGRILEPLKVFQVLEAASPYRPTGVHVGH